ncbi:MAG: hypothetical protein WAZ18_03355 [Alphaproteobacteria bacterium]
MFHLYAQWMQQMMAGTETQRTCTQAWNDAVTTIMAHRSQAVTRWWQQAPAQWQQCVANPHHMAAWYGQTLQQACDLTNDTTAARIHLLKVWQRQNASSGAPTPSTTATSAPRSTSPSVTLTPTVLGQPQFGSPQLKGTFIPAAAPTAQPLTQATAKVMAALAGSNMAAALSKPSTPQRTSLPRIVVPKLTRTGTVSTTTKAVNALRQPLEQQVQQASSMEALQPHAATNVLPFAAPVPSSTATSFARNSSRAASLNGRRGVSARLSRGRAR